MFHKWTDNCVFQPTRDILLCRAHPVREKHTPITSAYFSTHATSSGWILLVAHGARCKPQCRLAPLRQNELYSFCCFSAVRIIQFCISEIRTSASFVSWFLFPENNDPTPPPPPSSPRRKRAPKAANSKHPIASDKKMCKRSKCPPRSTCRTGYSPYLLFYCT